MFNNFFKLCPVFQSKFEKFMLFVPTNVSCTAKTVLSSPLPWKHRQFPHGTKRITHSDLTIWNLNKEIKLVSSRSKRVATNWGLKEERSRAGPSREGRQGYPEPEGLRLGRWLRVQQVPSQCKAQGPAQESTTQQTKARARERLSDG